LHKATMIITVISYVPYSIGWLGGKLVLFIKFVYNAIKVGYLDALGEDAWLNEIYHY